MVLHIVFLWSVQQCMQDLMDGYFPSELEERFPDGVPFEASLPFLPFSCLSADVQMYDSSKNVLCRFMTDEMRNLSSGYLGRKMNRQVSPALRYMVCPAEKNQRI